MATETAVDVVMPQMGVSVSEGTITRWLKQEGEQIEADEPLLEISTDKVDTEVPSPASGTLTQILVQEGETVDVGTKLGQIGGSPAGETPATPGAPEPEAAPPVPATSEAETASAAETPAPPEPPATPPAAAPQSGNGKAFVSPVVARIASEHGVDPSQVPGTGSGGRVTKKDILAFVESGGAQPPAAPHEPAQAEAPAAPPAQAPAAPAAPPAQAPPAPPPPKPPAPAPVAAGETLPGETVEPVTAMRRGIAEHMRRSLDTAAHVTSAIEVDFSRIVAVRNTLKKEYQAAYGVNPTY